MRSLPAGDRWLRVAGASAGLVLVAVAAAVDPLGFRPYTTLRWAVVGVASAVAAAGVAFTATTGSWRPPRRLVAAWVGLLAWLTLATVVALDPLVALVGHPRRHLGLAGWVVCALAFAAGTGLRGPEARRHLGRAAVVAAAVTGAGALADLFGWDPPAATFGDGRIGGLLGQPVYLGAAAVLLAPVAIGVAADASDDTPAGRWWRRAGAAAGVACVVAVVASQTRGAWVGLGAAAVVAWPAVRRWVAVRQWVAGRRRTVAAGSVVLASLAVVGAFGPLGVLGSRAVGGFDPVTGSGRGRLDEWAVAAAVVADHPLTGVGPEGYRVAAPGHIGDGYARLHGRDEVVDRAHDGLLDVAVSGGLPAAALYLALVAGVVARCLRAVRRPPDPVVAGAAAGLVAWVVQQLVSFPIAEIDPAAWLLAGAVAVAVEPPPRVVPARRIGVGSSVRATPRRWFSQAFRRVAGRRAGVEAVQSSVSGGRADRGSLRGPGALAGRWAAVGRVGVGVVAAVVAVVVAVGGGLAVVGDRELQRAESAAGPGGPDVGAVDAADRATALRPDDVDAWYVAARVATLARPGLLGVDAGLDRVEDGLRRSPRDPALRTLHEALLVERALRSGLPGDLRAARSAAEELVADDPAGPAHHRSLGLVLAAQGRDEPAAAELRRALDLDPDDTIARAALDDLAPEAAG